MSSPASSAGSSTKADGSVTSASIALPQPSDLDRLIHERRYADILGVAQRKEMEDGGGITKETEPWYCVELYAAALAKEILTSKFIWKRIPKDLKKKSKDIQIVWRLLQSLHKGEFVQFFGESLAFGGQLSNPVLQSLNNLLIEETRNTNVQNIRRAYTTIGIDQASTLLGVKKEQTAAYLTQLGWTPDAQAPTQFFNPTPLVLPKQREISVQQIQELTKYIAHLEDE